MHERHALHHGFLVEPATIEELLEALPADQLFPRLHLRNEGSEDLLDTARSSFVVKPSGASSRIAGVAGAHYVFWTSGEFFLEGVLYAIGGDADQRSPVALVNRFDRALVYGPGVVGFGALVLGAALVHAALSGDSIDEENHRDIFEFAPWPSAGRR